jgi:hypothetical protein
MSIHEAQYYGLTALTAVPVTVAICLWRGGTGKRVSWGTILLGAGLAATFAVLWQPVYLAGRYALIPEFWASYWVRLPQYIGLGERAPTSVRSFRLIWGLNLLACILPATAVVCYYQNRQKRGKGVV